MSTIPTLGFGSSANKSFPGLTVAPDGKTVYLAGPGGFDGILWIWARDTSGTATHGNLSLIDCIAVSACGRQVPNMNLPADIAVTPDNKQLIVAGGEGGSHTVVGFNRNISATRNLRRLGRDSRELREPLHHRQPQPRELHDARSGQEYPRGLSIANNRDIYIRGYYSVTAIRRDASATRSTRSRLPRSAPPTLAHPTRTASSPAIARGLRRSEHLRDSRRQVRLRRRARQQRRGEGFTRNASNGSITQNPTLLGCLTTSVLDGAARIRQGTSFRSLVGEPSNKFIYGAGGGRVFSFAIDHAPVCNNVSASGTLGSPVTVSFNCSDPDGDALTFQKVGGSGPTGGALADSFQGNTITYNAFRAGSDSFKFRVVAAGVASDPATAFLNIASPPSGGGGGGGGGTPPPPVLTVVPSTTSINSLAFPKFTKIVNLSAQNLQAGSTVLVTCKTKKKKQQKKGCPYKKKRFTTSGARASLNLRKPFKKKKVPVGHEDHHHDHRPRLPRQAHHLHHPRRQAAEVQGAAACSATGKAGSCA